MIAELVDVWTQIIIRAVIVVGLGSALFLLVVVGGIAGAVYWFIERRHTTESAEEHTEVLEYDEAA